MKKITITLTDEAEKIFNDLMYALPKEEDGTGMCNQSEAICYALQRMIWLEKQDESKLQISEGDIEWAFKDNAKWELADRTKMMNFEEFKAAINELTTKEKQDEKEN